jgi:hypothetical protein
MERGRGKMFRSSIGAVSTLLFGMLIFGASIATAGEPQEINKKRTSDAGGPYFNLYTHEKASAIFFGGEILTDEAWMFTDKCCDLAIHYVTFKKATGGDQTVMESCAGGFKVPSDDRAAKVTWSYEKEYVHFFAEVRWKPDKEENGRDPGFKLWYQSSFLDTCNHTDPPVPDSPVYPDFPVYIESPDPSPLGLGPMDFRNVYGSGNEELTKYETKTSKGKENVQPTDITRLFRWLGWFCQANIFDTDSDGNADTYGFSVIRTY